MSALSIQVPFPVFQDRDGQPLENGYVWIGQPNLAPQVNPVNVYFDAALTQQVAQPLRTINGYISNAGTPAQVYVDGVNFSILVQDSKGSMVYNFPECTGISPDACGVEYSPPFTGGVPYPVCEKLAQTVSVKDFGAVGDGVTDDTAEIQAAIDYAFSRTVITPLHNGSANSGGICIDGSGFEYAVSASLNLPAGGNVQFQNMTIRALGTFPAGNYIFDTNGSVDNDFVKFTNICIDGNAVANGIRIARFIRWYIYGVDILNVYKYGIYLDTIGFELVTDALFIKGGNQTDSAGIFVQAGCTDNHFCNVVIEGFDYGIYSRAQANIYRNVHTYTIANDGIYLAVNTSMNDVQGCYFDGNTLRIDNPLNSIIANNRFIKLSGTPNGIILNALTSGHQTQNLTITGNVFNLPSGSDAIVTAGTFDQDFVRKVIVKDNVGGPGVTVRATRFIGTETVSSVQTKSIDISAKRLFGRIEWVSVTLKDSRNNTFVPCAAVYGSLPTTSFDVKGALIDITGGTVTGTNALDGTIYYEVETSK